MNIVPQQLFSLSDTAHGIQSPRLWSPPSDSSTPIRSHFGSRQPVAILAQGIKEALQVTRAPGSELTLDDVVKLMRVPDGPMNWGRQTTLHPSVAMLAQGNP